MEINKEEFDSRFKETLDHLLEEMAQNSEISVNKFYSMTCILENLAFFSPVIFGLLKKPEE